MRQTRPRTFETVRTAGDPTARDGRTVILRLVVGGSEASPSETSLNKPPLEAPFPGARPTTESAADPDETPSPRRFGSGQKLRPYLEAAVGWLVIFGWAYIALLAFGD